METIFKTLRGTHFKILSQHQHTNSVTLFLIRVKLSNGSLIFKQTEYMIEQSIYEIQLIIDVESKI